MPSNAEDTTGIQTHNISDDGFVNVPLQFDFPYYGQTFNNSWMFSNGIISFRDPTVSGLEWYNLSVQNFSSLMGSQFDYSIYPLWTDLINITGTFRTQGTSQFQRYDWIGISPFYDSNRLNTFSVEIRPDGSIKANYTLIDVNYASVGIVGNSSAGEYDQILYSSSSVNTNSLSNWERYTYGVQDPIKEPKQDFQSITETPAVIVIETNTGVEAIPIVQSQPLSSGQNSSLDQTQSSGSGISISSVLNIISREQARIVNLERSTIESSVEQSINQALQATQDAEAIAGSAQSESILVGLAVQASQPISATSNFSLRDSASSSTSLSSTLRGVDTQSITEEAKNDAISVSEFSATNILKQEENISREETQRKETPKTVKQNVPNNELAGNVSIASLGMPPQGFQAYSIGMPDSTFYAPREIYRNQVVIDNPVGRRLFSGTDNLHQRMIDQQYNTGK